MSFLGTVHLHSSPISVNLIVEWKSQHDIEQPMTDDFSFEVSLQLT